MTSSDCTNASLPDGLLLVLNNCEDRLQLVLGETLTTGTALLCSRELMVQGRTAGFLIPAVAEMLAEQERPVDDIAAIACTRGPGSFTGVRLALSAAAGLQAGCGAVLAGLDYLPLVASAPLLSGQAVTVLTYARRGQVYLQDFAPDGTPLTDVMPMPATHAAERIRERTGLLTLVGTGLQKNSDIFQPLANDQITLLSPAWNHPKPDLLLAGAAEAAYSMEPPEPAYGRNADAEDNIEEIAIKRGIDPAKAKQMLDDCRKDSS